VKNKGISTGPLPGKGMKWTSSNPVLGNAVEHFVPGKPNRRTTAGTLSVCEEISSRILAAFFWQKTRLLKVMLGSLAEKTKVLHQKITRKYSGRKFLNRL